MNRSGYYKWRQRQGKMNRYERDRVELTRLLQAAHEKHPSHGYHRLAHEGLVSDPALIDETKKVFMVRRGGKAYCSIEKLLG